MNQREGDEAGAVFGYVETGEVFGFVKTREVRPLRSGDWYAFNGGVLPAMNEHVDGDAYPIVRPLIRGRDVVVDAKMVERLREACVYADRNHANLSACRDRLWGATRALLASIPPAAPADPLESEEFRKLLDTYSGSDATDAIDVLERIQEYLREHAAGIAAAAKEAT